MCQPSFIPTYARLSDLLGGILPLPARQKIGMMLYPSDEPKIFRVSPHRLIRGPCNPCELEAMRYVTEHTSIPVPKILAVHHHEGFLYIEMEFVKGTELAVAWMKEGFLSDEQKKSIMKDIGNYVAQLRELEPPKSGTVSSALGKPVHDCRIGSRPFGPMSHDDLHSLVRGNLVIESCATAFGDEAARVHTGSYKTRFTHADLAPRNIMVRKGRVVAIIDWAFSGWYPEYWEFTKAHYGLFPLADWYAAVYEVLPRYDTELVAERSLWTRYDEPGNPRR